MIAVSALLVALAVWIHLGARPDDRLARLRRPVAAQRADRDRPQSVRLVSAVAGVSLTWLLGWPLGFFLGLGIFWLLPGFIGRLEPRTVRRRRAELSRAAPVVADLLAATLASGAGMRDCLRQVERALGEPVAGALRPVIVALDLGADPIAAWQLVDDLGTLAPVAEAAQRSAQSGAALSFVLARIADDLRREQRMRVGVAARSAGVRAVAPLAACFLPAFLLLGVAPVVVSLASSLMASPSA